MLRLRGYNYEIIDTVKKKSIAASEDCKTLTK